MRDVLASQPEAAAEMVVAGINVLWGARTREGPERDVRPCSFLLQDPLHNQVEEHAELRLDYFQRCVVDHVLRLSRNVGSVPDGLDQMNSHQTAG